MVCLQPPEHTITILRASNSSTPRGAQGHMRHACADPRSTRALCAQGLSATLFERLQATHGSSASAMLTTQYRMHGDIMGWSSNEFYGGRLTAHPSVAAHTLSTLGKVRLAHRPELHIQMHGPRGSRPSEGRKTLVGQGQTLHSQFPLGQRMQGSISAPRFWT